MELCLGNRTSPAYIRGFLSAEKLQQQWQKKKKERKKKENLKFFLLQKEFFIKFYKCGYRNHIRSEINCDVKHNTGHSNLFSPKAVNTNRDWRTASYDMSWLCECKL